MTLFLFFFFEPFSKGTTEHLRARLLELRGGQMHMHEDAVTKGQRTKIENQIRIHEHRMQERRDELESMRLGAFPAPELLNMVIVAPH